MLDILLDCDGDLHITPSGDIYLTQNARQAVRIRLLWFFNEWRFAPGLGVPYFEEVFIKNPNINRLRRIVYEQAKSVDGVIDVRNININIENAARKARFCFDLMLQEETYREEVEIPWGVNMD